MLTIGVTAEIAGALQGIDDLAWKIRERVITAALNKTADKGKAEMTRAITDVFAITQSKVRPRLKVHRATRNNLMAVIEAFPSASGKRAMNVIAFGALKKTKGVSVKIKRAGGRKVIAGAFIANAGRTVFWRLSQIGKPGTTMATRSGSKGVKHREKITGVMTIDIPSMFNTRTINARVVNKIEREFPVELERAKAFFLAKA